MISHRYTYFNYFCFLLKKNSKKIWCFGHLIDEEKDTINIYPVCLVPAKPELALFSKSLFSPK